MTKKNNKPKLILAGSIILIIIIYVLLRPLTMSAIYSQEADNDLSQATTEVNRALAGFSSQNLYTGKTSCSVSWYKISTNCKTKTQAGTISLNEEQRSTFQVKSASIEQSLQNYGWLGNGWLKSFAYNVVTYPTTSTPGGVYRKPVRGGDCYFTFSSAYISSSVTTVLYTQTWCDKGTPTYQY